MTAVPDSMWAIRLHPPLVYERVETPRPGPGEALVRVHAAAITRDELEWPVDRLPATPSYEFSGVVAAIADDVDGLAVGDEVYALGRFERDGAAAEYAVVPSGLLARKPQTLGHVESAALPLASAERLAGALRPRQAGGRRASARPRGGRRRRQLRRPARPPPRRTRDRYGVAREASRQSGRLGADEVVDNMSTRFEEIVAPVDLVFDTAGGECSRVHRGAARGGRLVSVAEEPPGDGDLLRRRARTASSSSSSRASSTAASCGRLVDSVFPLAEARAAFERSMAAGQAWQSGAPSRR